MIQLNLRRGVPIYEQLKSRVGELVLLGVMQPNEQLPSVRSLARELGVNPNTVSKAYSELEHDGVIYSIPGKGSFISESPELKNQLIGRHLARITQEIKEALTDNVPPQQIMSTVQSIIGEDLR